MAGRATIRQASANRAVGIQIARAVAFAWAHSFHTCEFSLEKLASPADRAKRVALDQKKGRVQSVRIAASGADFDVIAASLDRLAAAAKAGSWAGAEHARLEAYGIFELGPEQRLRGIAPSLGFGLGKDLKIPKLEDAIKAIAAAAQKHKLVPGAFGGSPENCAYFAGHGFKFIAAATDVGLLAAGAKAMQDQLGRI